MKKRILAVFTALVLCLSMLTSSVSVGATDTPHFVAVDIKLLQLEDRYIPIIADGLYYVPYYVLDVYSTGVDLGVYPVYNAAIRTLTIYNREKVIAFDLVSGTCSDRDGTVFSARAVTRNGQVYVPAKFICDYFGLKYTYFPQTKFGPMIRIYTSETKLNDEFFLAAAQMMMEDRLNEWRKNQTVTPTPTPTPTTTTSVRPTTSSKPTTSAGTTTPVTTPTVPEVDKSDVRTYLAFRADQTDGLNSLLTRLEQQQIQALFFFPAEELAQYDEIVRRVLCGGHGVGLLTSGTTAEEIAASAAEGNRILSQIAHLHTYIVLAPDAENVQTLEAVRENGLLPWDTDVDATPNGQTVSARTNDVMEKTETYTEKVCILSDCSTSGATLMARLLPELLEDRYDLRLALETDI